MHSVDNNEPKEIKNYSINLMWVNNRNKPFENIFPSYDKYICLGKDTEASMLLVLEPMLKWKQANPRAQVNFWYDGNYTHSIPIENTRVLLERECRRVDCGEIQLRDIRDIDIVKANPDNFSYMIPIYFRIDLLKLIICVHSMQAEGNDSAIFTDFSIGGEKGDPSGRMMSKEQLFKPDIMNRLKAIGMLMGKGALGPENQFIQVINSPDIINAIKHIVNANLFRTVRLLDFPNGPRKEMILKNYNRPVFLSTRHDIYAYLIASKSPEGIKVRADIIADHGRDTEWVKYDPKVHGYQPFGDEYFAQDSSFRIIKRSNIANVVNSVNAFDAIARRDVFSLPEVEDLYKNESFKQLYQSRMRSDLQSRMGNDHNVTDFEIQMFQSDPNKSYFCKFWEETPIKAVPVMSFSKVHAESVKAKLKSQAFDKSQSLALQNACAIGDVARVQSALAGNADINFVAEGAAGGNCTGLQLAILCNKPDVLVFLLRQPTLDVSNRDVNGRTAIQLALDHSRFEMAHQISTLAINQRVLNAAASGNLLELEKAIQDGADVNSLNPVAHGAYNAVQLAIKLDKIEIVAALVAEGADLDYFGNQEKKTAVELAKDSGNSFMNEIIQSAIWQRNSRARPKV